MAMYKNDLKKLNITWYYMNLISSSQEIKRLLRFLCHNYKNILQQHIRVSHVETIKVKKMIKINSIFTSHGRNIHECTHEKRLNKIALTKP